MKARIIFAIIVFLFVSAKSFAQERPLAWRMETQNQGHAFISSLSASESDIYMTGIFRDSINLGGIVLQGKGLTDVFAARMDKNGSILWVKNLGKQGDDAAGRILAQNNNMFVSGTLADSLNSDKYFQNPGGFLFLNRFDVSGNQVWVKHIEFRGHASMDVLENGPENTVVAGGRLRGCFNLDGLEMCSGSNEKAFTIVFTQEGEIKDKMISEGSGNHRTIAVHTDHNGNLYQMTAVSPGTFSMDFFNRSSSEYFTNTSIILSKYNEELKPLWAKKIQVESFAEGNRILVDKNGYVFIGMNYGKSICVEDSTINALGQLDIAIIRFTPSGYLDKITTIESPNYSRLMDMSLYKNQLILAGYYMQEYTTHEMVVKSNTTGNTTFLMQIDDLGEPVWQVEIGSDNENYASTVVFDDHEGIVIGGGITKRHSKGESTDNIVETEHSVFVERYQICQPLHFQINAPTIMCAGDTVNLNAPSGFEKYWWNNEPSANNNYSITEPGKYFVTLLDKSGCTFSDTVYIDYNQASIVSLGPDTNLKTGESLLLYVDTLYTNYYWGDNHQPRHRVVDYDIEYSELQVVLFAKQEDLCWGADTVTVSFDHTLTIEDPDSDAEGFFVYPNPVIDDLGLLYYNQNNSGFIMELFDSRGLLLYQKSHTYTTVEFADKIDMRGFNPGVYILRLTNSDKQMSRTVIKK